MKIYAIRNDNDSNSRDLAYLFYFEKQNVFNIEIKNNEELKRFIPISLLIFVNKNKYSLNSFESLEWVKQRIVPRKRQNIVQILNDLKLDHYNEHSLIRFTSGRCSQDDCYLKEIDIEKIDKSTYKRFNYLIENIAYIGKTKIIVFFKNGDIKKCDLAKIVKEERYKNIINDYSRYKDISINAFGYGIDFSGVFTISNKDLYESGVSLRIDTSDFYEVIKELLVSTKEAASILNCSRQNIADLVKRNKLKPIKQTEKEMLFLKSDILNRLF